MKKILLGMAAAWLSFSVMAEDVLLNSPHPDSHTVVKGDTLWGISARFLQNPWMWPEIWQANPQIDNPHLIYPGDVIKLIYLDGRPRLVVERGEVGKTFKLSPSMRIEPLGNAIPAIPLDSINSFLSRSRVLEDGDFEQAPYVLVGAEKHLILGAGDQIYSRGEFEDLSPMYGVYRKGQEFIDPETSEVLGIQALDIGSVKMITKDDDIATLSVSRTTKEIRVGDRLLPNEQRSVDSIFFPSAPEDDIEGVVIAVEGGLTQVGQWSVVALNRGERDNLAIGNVLAIFKNGGQVRDRLKGDIVNLPDERAGLLMVFRTFEKMSYALVLETTRPLSVNDKVRNP